MPELLSSKLVTARKDHWCYACRTMSPTIHKGDQYWREGCVADGRAYTLNVCRPCARISPEVFRWAWSPDEGIMDEDYWNWAHEHRDNSPDFTVEARAYLARCGCSCEVCQP